MKAAIQWTLALTLLCVLIPEMSWAHKTHSKLKLVPKYEHSKPVGRNRSGIKANANREFDCTTQTTTQSWAQVRMSSPDYFVDEPQNMDYVTSGGEDVTIYILSSGARLDQEDFQDITTGEQRISLYQPLPDQIPYIENDPNGLGTHMASAAIGKDWGMAKHAKVIAWVTQPRSLSIAVSIVADCLDILYTNLTDTNVDPKKTIVVFSPLMDIDESSQSIIDRLNKITSAGYTLVLPAGMKHMDVEQTTSGNVDNAIIAAYTGVMESTNSTVFADTMQDEPPLFSGETVSHDTLGSQTDYGSSVTLCAPGDRVTVASHTGPTSTRDMGGNYITAGYTAGILATLMRETNFEYDASELRRILVDNAFSSVVNFDVCTNYENNICSATPNRLLSNLCNKVIQLPGGDDDDNTIMVAVPKIETI